MSSILLPIGTGGGAGTPNISGNVGVSGNVAVLSGQLAVLSGQLAILSGSITVNSGTIFLPSTTQSGHNYILEVGSASIVVTASGAGIGSFASGGMTLASSGPLISVTLRNQSGNGPVMIGGATGTSGTASVATGVEMFANESLTMKVSNTNLLSVWNETAGTSGQKVWILGLQQT